MENNKWLQWAIELQSLAQAGLTYGKDKFDQERYTRIREISAEMMSLLSDTPMDLSLIHIYPALFSYEI